VNDWRLVYEGFGPEQEPLREALCTLGNGYLATRGAAEESRADGVHCPGCDWFHPGRAELLSYRQELDMRRGLLSRDLRFRDAAGRVTRVTSRRLVHMLDPHVAALEYVLCPENWWGGSACGR